jgi:hypothetical protein
MVVFCITTMAVTQEPCATVSDRMVGQGLSYAVLGCTWPNESRTTKPAGSNGSPALYVSAPGTVRHRASYAARLPARRSAARRARSGGRTGTGLRAGPIFTWFRMHSGDLSKIGVAAGFRIG